MSLVDDDTVLRDSKALRDGELEAEREITQLDASETQLDSLDEQPDAGVIPQRLSHYVLLSKLGQGGMGVVHAAYDETLDRKVAIKLLRTGHDRKARKRLVREAQSLAKLSHPNVVQIYEIGTSDDLLFLVMEFVKGQTLRSWLNQRPRSQAEILEVFTAAGRGLAAAHAVGLVHRDFKPDNLMIRDDGRVMVMDFGLAYLVREGDHIDGLRDGDMPPLHEPSGLTATGVLVGTPAYMAPEQFEGRETDARTDQFSLCVALWESLHGQRPFAGASLMELSVAVCTGSVSMPIQSDVPSWLRKVIARGLAVDPSERWPSLEALLDALGRDPTRQRRGLALGIGLLAALIGSTAALRMNQQRELGRERRACTEAGQAIGWTEDLQTDLAARFSATKLGFADSAWTHTRALLDGYAEAWTETRTRVCVETKIEHTRSDESHAMIVACLDEQRARFQGLFAAWTELDESTVMRATAAAAQLPPLSLCTDERQLARRIPPPPELADAVAEQRTQLGQIVALHFAGKFAVARERSEAVLREAETIGWPPLLAEARYMLGLQLYRLGEYEAARALLEQAYADAVGAGHDVIALDAVGLLTIDVGGKLAQVERGLAWGRLGTKYIERLGFGGTVREARLLDDIASVHARAGNYDEALAMHQRAHALLEAELGPQHIHVGAVMNNIGSTYWNMGAYAEAQAAFERALAIREVVFGADHPDVATSLNNIGAVAWAQGNYAVALRSFERVLQVRERAFGPTNPEVATSLGNLGAAQAELGRNADALASFRRALAIQEQVLGPEHPDLAASLANVAIVLRSQGQLDEALAMLERAREILERSLGPEHHDVAMTLDEIGSVLHDQGELERARATFEQALAQLEGSLGPEHHDVATLLVSLGSVLVELAERDDERERAIELFRRALQINETALGPDHPNVADTLDELGAALRLSGSLDEALAAHRRAMELRSASLGPEHPKLAISSTGIGLVLLEQGELEAARVELERGLALRTAANAGPRELGESEFALARLHERAGRLEQAHAAAERARAQFMAAGAKRRLAELDTWKARLGHP